MKKGVLILIDMLYPSGAENVAVNIALKLKESKNYSPYICSTRAGGELESKLKMYNIEYSLLRRNHSYEINRFLPLRQIIRDKNIKIIHAHKLGSNLWGGLIGNMTGIPVISHFHAHHRSLESLKSLIAAKVINRLSTKIISISEFERERLIKEEGIDPVKIITIHNGINPELYKTTPHMELKKELGLKPDMPVVGCVAAFREQKNHELLILAAREVISKNESARFILVGDGTTKNRIQKMATQLDIIKNFVFTGLRNDVPDLISIFDVSILSSHWEGLPISVLEYMASGKPVVCTDVSGLSELVEDQVNGFLVPPGDHNALAGKIDLLLNDKELAFSMGKKGLSIVQQKFTEDTMMSQIESLYNEIIRSE